MNDAIKVMSSGSAEPGLNFVAEAFEKATGQRVEITYNKDIEGFDVLVASSDALQRRHFRREGLVEEEGFVIGRIGLGVAVRPGAALPDLSSAQSLKQAVLDADGLILTENHSSGLYIESMLRKLEIFDKVASRIAWTFNGPAAMDRVLAGQGREMTILSLNEIRTYLDKGLVLAGPLPQALQHARDFVAVAATGSPRREAAREFARFCGGPGRRLMAQHGFD